jgi:5'-nucleotidase
VEAQTELSNYIQTYTGRKIEPLNPNPDDICIEDIAHSLSMQCRWTGHTAWFYSVAQHSVLVSEECDEDTALWGLLHDASEAYLVDLARPVKRLESMRVFREAEEGLQRAIATKFRLQWPIPAHVHLVDNVLLRTEYRDLMKNVDDWSWAPDPLKTRIMPWESGHAHTQFMARFEELTEVR